MLRLPQQVTQRKRRLRWRTGATVALILLSIAGLVTASIVTVRQDALDEARLRAAYLSAALQQDVEGMLSAMAVASELVKRLVEAEGDGAPLAELKRDITKYLPDLINISVIGADGRLRATSGDVASSPASYSQFEFFIANRDSRTSGFRLGKPLTGLRSEQVILPATQRLETKEGAFAGVVLFSIDAARATAMYRRVDLGNSGSLMVAGSDGIIFGGYVLPRGLDPSLFGAPLGNRQLAERMREEPSGSMVAMPPADGIERVYSWRKLKDFPLIALVGLGKEEVLVAAHRQALFMMGLGIFSAILLLSLTAMLSREIFRRIRQALALDAQRRQLKEQNTELATAKRQAEEANQSKSLFLANIGHELRTPLTAIIGFSEIIRDKTFGEDPRRYSEYASDIYGSAVLNAPAHSTVPVTVERYRNKSFPNLEQANTKVRSFEECETKCLNGGNCVAYTYLKPSKS